MSKFHINKHGVPAPCKAKEGNCPLGGAERHFPNQEAAQEYADKVNMEKHGHLPVINNKEVDVQVSEEVYNDVFYEPYINNGYPFKMTGIHRYFFEEAEQNGDEDLVKLRNALPKDLFKDRRNFTLIPEENVKKFHEYHTFSPYLEEYNESHYNNIIKTIESKQPDQIKLDTFGTTHIKDEFKGKLVDFATERSLSESNLSINNKKALVARYEERNWAEEYFKSKEYEYYQGNKYQATGNTMREPMNKDNVKQVLDNGLSEEDLSVSYNTESFLNTPVELKANVSKVGEDEYKVEGEVHEYSMAEEDFESEEEFNDYLSGGPDTVYDVDFKFSSGELKNTLVSHERIGDKSTDPKETRGTILAGVYDMSRDNLK